MQENTKERTDDLLEVISVVATLVRAVFAALHYVHDIRKDKQQKSNHPLQG